MISVNALISLFQTMYKERWEYVWGKAESGCVDCAGAFTYAFSKLGGKISHGSNTIERRYTVGGLLPISFSEPGMAAFKAKNPGEEGYHLPDKFLPGGASYNGDLTDYYHIGLVDDDVRYVLNAKGEKYGFCRDGLTTQNGWDFVAYLKDVDYGEGEQMPDDAVMATVVLPQGASGNTVNMRKGAGKDQAVVAKVPVGDEVSVVQDKGAWCEVVWKSKRGWMMSNYLEYTGQDGETDNLTIADREKIEEALKLIEKAVDMIGGIVGRG